MKLITVLFLSFIVNGQIYPAEDIAGDRFVPIIMPDKDVCKAYRKRILRVKDATLPKLMAHCTEISSKYLPDRHIFYINRKRMMVFKIGLPND